VGARYEGYAASVGRGVFFGTPDPWVLEAIQRGYEAESLVMSELYDGNNAGTVARKYIDFLAKTGHDKNLLYGPCHATGLMEGEPPWIESDSDYIIHENMCYCIDIFMGNPNGYGLRVEDSVRVGKTGGDDYTAFPKEIFRK
jgi:Xaa-Pro aminopeptidase